MEAKLRGVIDGLNFHLSPTEIGAQPNLVGLSMGGGSLGWKEYVSTCCSFFQDMDAQTLSNFIHIQRKRHEEPDAAKRNTAPIC
jgi:hypothetical protein